MAARELGDVPDIRPRPDPTLLTTAALKQSIENLKELLQAQISHISDVLESRINLTNVLKEEKFKETWQRLDLAEKQRLEDKGDNEKALAAALKSQEQLFAQRNKCNEEAASKAEASFTKQIESISKEARIERNALSDRISVLEREKDKGSGKYESQVETHQIQGWLIPVLIIGGISACALIVNVIALFMHVPK